ncbi:hypothetical protein VOWphi5012_081 [Vibrio phage phi50-12]|uniref:Uncharacterized protein n=1 Tax=Vibrio phage phi50-12 TaxID=2654972 RepID=A0A5P8PRI0_9CAUD|nr:hypothetical protein KNU82_gp081 [Vibrio phage phi50-12]QFR59865.1 hypothetical protein VOWphi5012_081 [Vibrio phage phi50-12]
MKALVTITDNTPDSKKFLELNNLTTDSKILVKLDKCGDIVKTNNHKFDFYHFGCLSNDMSVSNSLAPEFIVILTKED